MSGRIDLPEARTACPTTSHKLLSEGALLVDVRESSELAEASFGDCEVMHIPLSEFETRWHEVPQDRDVILACAAGARSLKATYFLMYKGYTRVTNMSLGMKRWLERGFPVVGSGANAATGTADACCSTTSPAKDSGCCDAASATGDNACCGASKAAATSCC